MEDNTNNQEESKVDQLKEDVQDAKDLANIGTKAAAGNYAGAAKDAAKKVANEMKDPKKLAKKIARKVFRMLIPIIAIILIALLFFGAIFEIARIIKEKLVEIKDKILGWIGKWTTGDGIVVDDDDVDELLDDLSAQGIDLADLGFMADEEDVEEDEDYKNIDNDDTLSEKEKKEKKAKKKARKYIKRYMEAALVTQTAWTDKNGLVGIPGGIKLERHDAMYDTTNNMTYVENEEDLTIYKYTLDSDGKIVYLGRDGSKRTLDTSTYEQYELPIMFFIDLCLATQNPRYVLAIADYIAEGASASKVIRDYSTESTSDDESNSETNSEEQQNNTSMDGFLFLGDSRIEGIENQLEATGNNVTAIGVGSSRPSNWVDVTANGSGSVARGAYSNGSRNVQLPETANGVCIMLGTNGLNETSSMETVLNNLHTRYPDVTIYVDSIYHVGANYTYTNNIRFNQSVDTFNEWLQEFCTNKSWAKYVDISAGLYEDNGLLKTSYASDGLHIYSEEGIAKLIENMQAGVTGSSESIISGIIDEVFRNNWMTIRILDSCTVTTKTVTYTIYDPETQQTHTSTVYPEPVYDYTTSFYLVNVEHLLFKLTQTYDRTFTDNGDSVESGQSGDTSWTVTTNVKIYGFTSPIEQDPVIKCEDTDAFVRLSKMKFSVPYSGLRVCAYDAYRDGGEMMFALMDNNLDNELLLQMMKYVLYKMTGIDFGVTELETDIFNMSSYSPANSGRYATITEMIKLMEGTTALSSDGTQYRVENIGDGQRTVGPGVTLGNNASRFAEYGIDVSQYGVGSYIDKTIVDAVAMDCIADVAEQVNALGLDLENWQVDALVSRTYNCGAYGSTGLQAFKRAYNTYGDTDALYNNFMSTPVTDAYGNYYPGLTRRRRAEWKLFHEGIYEWENWRVDSKDVDYEGSSGITTQAEADALTEQYNEMLHTVVHNGNSYMQNGPFPKYWSYSYNALTPFQCTWWANGRASMYLEQYGTKYKKYPTQMGNGGEYYRINASNGWFNYGNTPKVNSIISWAGNPYGHVAYVEGVTSDGIWISDAGSGVTWRGVRKITLSYAASSNGYIYLDEPR